LDQDGSQSRGYSTLRLTFDIQSYLLQ